VGAKKADDDTPARGPLRALYDWMTRVAPSAVATPQLAPARPEEGVPSRIGHYQILGKLGQGGMGVVYLARDEKLERTVALKTMSALATDETARKRFRREAKAAASVNHPNVCQIYEIDEQGDEPFIAMELLEGEALSERLARGPLSVAETLPIGLAVLSALSALHAKGIVHRDLKPSNVFLTAHGVKLLDFGLARPTDPELVSAIASMSELTQTGMLVGTPRYMAPEQVTGDPLDARTDVFAAGAILFEMLAGRPAFGGKNAIEILHATLYDQPPALSGSPAVAAVDRVIRRALAKRPAERPASAQAMAEELGAVRGASGDDTPAVARALTRLVVLPFRVLRPDPETDFLAFSLPDAIATSLSGIGSLVVRSSATAARFAGDAPDLKTLAT
jgi:eukaryotic-like serine/threonine-protein kinase